jgi:hypothetical protein
MWKKILIAAVLVIGLLIGGLCAVVAMQPDTFAIERSATMDAPPAEIFAQVNDLHAWNGWSPWIDLDPNAKTSFSSPSAGKGATFGWSGNAEVGEGTLTIVDSQPNERVELEQEFVKPMAGKARIVFTLAPVTEGTKVTWRMDGTNDFAGKAMCLVMDMDAMLGPKFEEGLASIKRVVESKPSESKPGESSDVLTDLPAD